MDRINLKWTTSKILSRWNVFSVYQQKATKFPVKFGYWLGRNQGVLEPVIQHIDKRDKANEPYQEYLKETESFRQELNGVIIELNEKNFSDDEMRERAQLLTVKYNGKFAKLKEKYKGTLDERNLMLEIEEELSFFPIKLDLLPDELEYDLMSAITEFVVE